MSHRLHRSSFRRRRFGDLLDANDNATPYLYSTGGSDRRGGPPAGEDLFLGAIPRDPRDLDRRGRINNLMFSLDGIGLVGFKEGARQLWNPTRNP